MKNIALIILDSLGYEQFKKSNHPNINKITKVSLDNAFANASWTIPSHASILTGLMPNEHHAHYKSMYFIPPDCYLPKIIKKNCYGYVGVPFLKPSYGFDSDFDVYEYHDLPSEHLINEIKELKEPYFLFLNFHDTHYPYRAMWREDQASIVLYNMGEDSLSEEHLEELKKEQKNACKKVDLALKPLLKKLKDCKIIITSDHGDLYGEEHTIGHSVLLHHNSLHVPVIANCDIGVEPDQLFPLMDLYHVLLDKKPPIQKSVMALGYGALPSYPKRYQTIQVFYKDKKQEIVWLENSGEEPPSHLRQVVWEMKREPLTRMPMEFERISKCKL